MLKLFIEFNICQAFKFVFNMLEILLEQILNIFFLNHPGINWLLNLLFFLDDILGSVDFLFLQLVGFNSFSDLGFQLLFFLDVLLDIDKRVVSEFFIVFDFGDLLNLD